MTLLSRLMRRLGYVKLSEHDLVIGRDGRARPRMREDLPAYSFMRPIWETGEQAAEPPAWIPAPAPAPARPPLGPPAPEAVPDPGPYALPLDAVLDADLDWSGEDTVKAEIDSLSVDLVPATRTELGYPVPQTEPARRARGSTAPPTDTGTGDEDDWEWTIALARARAAVDEGLPAPEQTRHARTEAQDPPWMRGRKRR